MMHLPEHELWTPRLMRDALVHAIRVMRATPSRGYRTTAGTFADFNDVWGYADEAQNETRLRPTAEDITHMECILVGQGQGKALLNGAVLGYREHRRTLIRWALWVSSGARDQDGEPETEQFFALRIGLVEATMKRHRDFAAGVMADQANRESIKVWHVKKLVRPRKARGNLQVSGGA